MTIKQKQDVENSLVEFILNTCKEEITSGKRLEIIPEVVYALIKLHDTTC